MQYVVMEKAIRTGLIKKKVPIKTEHGIIQGFRWVKPGEELPEEQQKKEPIVAVGENIIVAGETAKVIAVGKDGVTAKIPDGEKHQIFYRDIEKVEESEEKIKVETPGEKILRLRDLHRKEVIYTEAFKSWFGNWEEDPEGISKVVDKDGEPQKNHPIKVYHGTPKDFTEFSKEKVGSGYKDISSNLGFHFTPEITLASRFSKLGNVMVVYLNIRNPLTTSESQFSFNAVKLGAEKGLPEAKKIYDEAIMVMEDYKKKYPKESEREFISYWYGEWTAGDGHQISGRTTKAVSKMYVEDLKSKGYDGIYYENELEFGGRAGMCWIAFEPNQIKSEDSMNFDPATNDIYKSKSIQYVIMEKAKRVFVPAGVGHEAYTRIPQTAARLVILEGNPPYEAWAAFPVKTRPIRSRGSQTQAEEKEEDEQDARVATQMDETWERLDEITKSRVKGHFSTIRGKRVWVPEYERHDTSGGLLQVLRGLLDKILSWKSNKGFLTDEQHVYAQKQLKELESRSKHFKQQKQRAEVFKVLKEIRRELEASEHRKHQRLVIAESKESNSKEVNDVLRKLGYDFNDIAKMSEHEAKTYWNGIHKSLEKARSHKYIRREGLPGNYTYIYHEPQKAEIDKPWSQPRFTDVAKETGKKLTREQAIAIWDERKSIKAKTFEEAYHKQYLREQVEAYFGYTGTESLTEGQIEERLGLKNRILPQLKNRQLKNGKLIKL